MPIQTKCLHFVRCVSAIARRRRPRRWLKPGSGSRFIPAASLRRKIFSKPRRNPSMQVSLRTPRLRALTLSPAEIFGVADRLGSIENGKIANLVITDGDLFDEKTKIKYVFVDGRRFTIHEPEKPKDPPKGDLTGKWKLSYTTPEGAEESTADLTMARDGALSGTVSSKRGTQQHSQRLPQRR